MLGLGKADVGALRAIAVGEVIVGEAGSRETGHARIVSSRDIGNDIESNTVRFGLSFWFEDCRVFEGLECFKSFSTSLRLILALLFDCGILGLC
jgi:hypothetical protein